MTHSMILNVMTVGYYLVHFRPSHVQRVSLRGVIPYDPEFSFQTVLLKYRLGILKPAPESVVEMNHDILGYSIFKARIAAYEQ